MINAVFVRAETVDQQVAFWPSIFVAVSEEDLEKSGEMERVVAPNEASVAKILSGEPGIRAEPKRTAVPFGELLLSFIARLPPWTGKMERKPVLLTIGFPLTVVRRAVLSELKKVCETVLNGPEGGVL